MKDETKQALKDAGWKALAFLGDHPVLRGFLLGLAVGFLTRLFF